MIKSEARQACYRFFAKSLIIYHMIVKLFIWLILAENCRFDHISDVKGVIS